MDVKEIFAKLAATNPKEAIAYLKGLEPRTWALIGGAVLGLALFWMFIFKPAWIDRTKVIKDIKDKEAQMTYFQTLNLKKPVLEKQQKEIESMTADFRKKLFGANEIAFLLGKISKIASEAKVELLASKPMDAEGFPEPYKQKYAKHLYQISVEGSYHQIADFVSLLETDQRFFQVQTLNIAPQADPLRHIADVRLIAVSLNSEPAGEAKK